MNLRRAVLDAFVVVAVFFAIDALAYFYFGAISPYRDSLVTTDRRPIALASAVLVGGFLAFASGLVSRKSAKLTLWKVVLMGSLVALSADLFIGYLGYLFFPVPDELIFVIFAFSLFGVIVGCSQVANPRQMRIRTASEMICALVGVGLALVTEQGWRSGVSLLFPDLMFLAIEASAGAAVGYVIGSYVEVVRLNQRSRHPLIQ
jgi:hypothetical protein